MIDVSELIVDPDFAQLYTVYRKLGVWNGGRFVETEMQLQFYGPITPANVKDVNMLPEGDRIGGLMVFRTTPDNPFLITRNTAGNMGTSDQPEWKGERYRILEVLPWDDFGHLKAIGTRTAGD